MKKLLSIVVALVLMFNFTSCATNKQMIGKKTKTDTGIKYENHYAKIGYDFDESWRVYNDVEMKSALGLNDNFTDKNGVFIDLYAKKKTGVTGYMNISFQEIRGISKLEFDVEELCEAVKSNVLYTLQNQGFKSVMPKIKKATFLGKEVYTIHIYAEYNIGKYYFLITFVETDYHIMQIDINTQNVDQTQEILSNFYALN